MDIFTGKRSTTSMLLADFTTLTEIYGNKDPKWRPDTFSMIQGNYIVSYVESSNDTESVASSSPKSPIVVVHQENVDPRRLVEKFHGNESEMKSLYESYATEIDDDDDGESTSKKRRLDPDDDRDQDFSNVSYSSRNYNVATAGNFQSWLTSSTDELDDKLLLDHCRRFRVRRKYTSGIKIECDVCKRRSVTIRTSDPKSALEIVRTDLAHKLYHAYQSPDPEKNWPFPYLDLVYFLNDITWMRDGATRSKCKITRVNKSLFHFEKNGERIGFAIKLGALPNDPNSMNAMITESESKRCIGLILTTCNEKRRARMTMTMDEALYDDQSGTYSQSIRCQGSTSQPAFDFANLPDEIFQQILSYLPWRDIARVRRVNVRFESMSLEALATATKVIDCTNNDAGRYRRMKTDDFERLLRTVAKKLTHLNLEGVMEPTELADLPTIGGFPALRKLECAPYSLSYRTFVTILEKCPNLKEFIGSIDFESITEIYYQNVHGLEKFYMPTNDDNLEPFMDSHLILIADHLPKLTHISLFADNGFVTNTCLSVFVERYGPQLIDFELTGDSSVRPEQMIGVFDGIASCTNLERLCLKFTSCVISEQFAGALARGCLELERLRIVDCDGLSNTVLSKLAALPNLRILTLEDMEDYLSPGITAIAQQGHLEQLSADETPLTAACLKACIRYCPNLSYLCVRGVEELTVDEAVELASTYGLFGQSSRLLIRSAFSNIWRHERVEEVQEKIRNGKLGRKRRLIIDCRMSADDNGNVGDEDYPTGTDVLASSDSESDYTSDDEDASLTIDDSNEQDMDEQYIWAHDNMSLAMAGFDADDEIPPHCVIQ